MSRSNGQSRAHGPRLSGYLNEADKKWWTEEFRRVMKLEGLRNEGIGMLFTRIAKNRLRLDVASIARYPETHPKRARDSDPAAD